MTNLKYFLSFLMATHFLIVIPSSFAISTKDLANTVTGDNNEDNNNIISSNAILLRPTSNQESDNALKDCKKLLKKDVTPAGLVAELIDTTANNIPYSNITYKGADQAAGIFCGDDEGLSLERGIILSSGNIAHVIGPNKCYKTTAVNRQYGDADLNQLGSGYTYDAATLEFDFVATGDKLEFMYVFTSEEYIEWTNSKFNDVFGFFLNGENIALIPETNPPVPVSINTINNNSNSSYFKDNNYLFPRNIYLYNRKPCEPGSTTPYETEMDGFTTILTAKADVRPNETYHIKLAVADRGDYSLDSAVLIKGQSFNTITLIPPPMPTKLDPSLQGIIKQDNPTYSWEIVPNVTEYVLVVTDDTGTEIINQSYTPETAQCSEKTESCSVTPDIELADNSSYQWSVKTINQSGSATSKENSFTVKLPPPAKAILISATGIKHYNNITYDWDKVPEATEYQLIIQDSQGQEIMTHSYPADQVNCESSICSITPSDILPDGSYQYLIKTTNEKGKTSLSEPMPFTVSPPVMICKVYGVHDEGLNGSQFFVIDQKTGEIKPLGESHFGYDIEGVDAHPQSRELLAASGKDAETNGGSLYKILADGQLEFLGQIKFSEEDKIHDISGLSFNPTNNRLWGWAQKKGPFWIELEQMPNTFAQLVWDSPEKFEDLTWDETGSQVYLAQQNRLLRYDNKTKEITPICILNGKKIESLEITPNGILLLAVDGNDTIYALQSPFTKANGQCSIEPFITETHYDDMEGMAFVCTTEE